MDTSQRTVGNPKAKGQKDDKGGKSNKGGKGNPRSSPSSSPIICHKSVGNQDSSREIVARGGSARSLESEDGEGNGSHINADVVS